MRAVYQNDFGGPSVLEAGHMADPEPKPGQVLVRVRACGVCGHDVLERCGVMRNGVVFPMVHGHEIAGEVVALGEGVESLAVGDRVASLQRVTCGHCDYCRRGLDSCCRNQVFIGHDGLTGGYAEYTALGERAFVKLPPDMPFEQAAVLGCSAGTVLHALRAEAKLQPGETVLVTGAGGGLGIHAVKLAKLFGGYVLATTTSEHKADILKAAGADDVIVAPDNDFAEEVKRATDGYGIDVLVDNVGAPVFKAALRVMAPYGRFLVVGQVTGDRITFNQAHLIFKNIRLIGSKSTHWHELQDMINLTHRGLFTPLIGQTLPLEEAARAHELVENRGVAGRVVLVQ